MPILPGLIIGSSEGECQGEWQVRRPPTGNIRIVSEATMTTREITIAFEFAIAVFAIYLLIRRLTRLGARRAEAPPFYIQEPTDDPLRDPYALITIAWFEMAEDAEKWAQVLQQAGIEPTVIGGWPRRIEGAGPPQLQVRSKDAQQAIEILRQAESSEEPDEAGEA